MTGTSTKDRDHIERFLGSGVDHPTLALVYGRRRIGKSTLLSRVAREHEGFYWEATRSATAVQLERLGEALGAHLGVGTLSLSSWDDAVRQLLRLGSNTAVPVVLDEFGYVLEADPSADSIVSSALGPAARQANSGQTRLILCGSAIALMRSLTAGQAPLRGRAGSELIMYQADFRQAAGFLGAGSERRLAAHVHAVIGGVIGYATDMVDHDLPDDIEDFDRWIAERILSPAATLHHEAVTLLAEDPELSSSPLLHHSILGAIANGSVTAGTIANHLRKSVPNLEPALKRLIRAGFVARLEDPVRAQRPLYVLDDPFLQFHYAILEPHGALLRDRDPEDLWARRLVASFDARVRGPVFEQQARTWVRRYADDATLGGPPDHVGPSSVSIDGVHRQLDVVVASAERADAAPGERAVTTIGEAKSGETVDLTHLHTLEQARSALGTRAVQAKLLLFAPDFTGDLSRAASRRDDVELIDLDRLYHGS